MAYFSTSILATAFLVTAQAAAVAAHQGPVGTHRQEPHLFVEVGETGDAAELRPQQPAPMYSEFYNAPVSGERQFSTPPTWPSQSFGFSTSQQDYINEKLNEKLSLVRREKDSSQEQEDADKARERALQDRALQDQAEQMARQAEEMAEQKAEQKQMAEQKARQAEEMAEQKRAAENAKEKARQAAEQKTVEQDAEKAKERAHEAEETERLQREQTVRQEHSEDMRRREAELEWKEQDPDEDDDEDDPKIDWAHEDRLRGWGREGWTDPKPSGVVHHHQDTKPSEAEAPKVNDKAAAAAASAEAQATTARKLDVPMQGASLPTSDLTPDVPLLQTSQ